MSTIYNDNNVYILGAGFSRLAGLPLIKDFMNKMRDTHERLEGYIKSDKLTNDRKAKIERLLTAVAQVFEYRLKASSVNYRVNIDLENIEQLFSLASLSNDEGLEHNIRRAICATIEGTYELFYRPEYDKSKRIVRKTEEYIRKAEKNEFDFSQGFFPTDNINFLKTELYTFVLSNLIGSSNLHPEQNSFITLNYDTIVERSLINLGLSFTYGISTHIHNPKTPSKYRNNGGIKVMKLHGSTNWIEAKDNSQSKNSGNIEVFPNFFNLAYDEIRDYTPLVLPPTWNKSAKGFLLDVWQDAIVAIRNATRIIVIGYSFSTTDNHINYLIAEGLRENISLRSIHIWDTSPKKVVENWSSLTPYSKSIIKEVPFNENENEVSLAKGKDIYKSINRGSSLEFIGKEML
ncbi:MAG: SIR2 family protein [Bacteroidetes bacterium]|nr:SIR2 family protein [Bacteroidota bacterium]